MTTLTQGMQTGEYVLSEGNGMISREQVTVTIAASTALPSGTVLGKIIRGAATSAFVGTGNGALTMDAVTPVRAQAKVGAYVATAIAAAANGGTFRVEDPDGFVLGDVAVGGTFDDDIKFVIADGATDFIVGDKFTITVAAGSGKYVKYVDTAVDGSDVAAGVLYNPLPGVNGDVLATVHVRDCEVIGSRLNNGVALDAPGLVDLAARGIVVR